MDNIFDLFKNEQSDQIIDYTQHPIYLLMMFNKIVVDHIASLPILIQQSKIIDPKLSVDYIIDKSNELNFNHAFDFLKKIQIENQEHQQYIMEQSDEILRNSLYAALKYFEKQEEYEKCSIIQQMHKKVSNNLATKYF